MIQTSVLENSLVERVIQRIAMAFHPRKIILFGSHAHGKSQTHSDIDLLLIYDGPLSKTTFICWCLICSIVRIFLWMFLS
jgi:predicted nucleotidyltransferase